MCFRGLHYFTRHLNVVLVEKTAQYLCFSWVIGGSSGITATHTLSRLHAHTGTAYLEIEKNITFLLRYLKPAAKLSKRKATSHSSQKHTLTHTHSQAPSHSFIHSFTRTIHDSTTTTLSTYHLDTVLWCKQLVVVVVVIVVVVVVVIA